MKTLQIKTNFHRSFYAVAKDLGIQPSKIEIQKATKEIKSKSLFTRIEKQIAVQNIFNYISSLGIDCDNEFNNNQVKIHIEVQKHWFTVTNANDLVLITNDIIRHYASS